MQNAAKEKVAFYNEEGEKIVAVWQRPAAGFSQVVVICHGFQGTKEGGGRAEKFAKQLVDNGYAVFCFDFSGNGESEGQFHLSNISKRQQDLKSVLDFVQLEKQRNIIVLGRSLGGAAAVAYAGQDNRVGGLITWSAPVNIVGTFKHMLGEHYKKWEAGGVIRWEDEFGQYRLEPDFLADLKAYELDDDVRSLNCPYLIVHGGNDEVVSVENAHRLFYAASEPKELVIIPGADHRFLAHQREIREVTLKWLLRQFPNV